MLEKAAPHGQLALQENPGQSSGEKRSASQKPGPEPLGSRSRASSCSASPVPSADNAWHASEGNIQGVRIHSTKLTAKDEF